jgi:hypothetical protein
MANALYSIEIYPHSGTWCFTDEERGLIHEPFVLGIPDFIDEIIQTNDLGELDRTYRIIFSDFKFPKCQGKLVYAYEEDPGVWYLLRSVEETEPKVDLQAGWLCPATLKFFPEFPKSIFFRIEPVK